MTGEIALRLEHISKHFGTVKAVDDLSLEIRAGEVLTLLGPSGCGKTTTLRVIAGLESPDAGELWFGDRLIVSVGRGVYVPTHKRNLGMVFQSYAIWPHMTVFENVAYPLSVRGVRGDKVRSQVMEALHLVGLDGLHDRQAPQLSGGQQQRVALARAIVHEPSILLLDEPFSNLDAKLREQMRVQLKVLLNRLRITSVFVTHDQIEALSLSDRIVVMSGGHVEQIGSPQQLYEAPATPFVRDFLGKTLILEGLLSDAGELLHVELDKVPGQILKAHRAAAQGTIVGGKVSVAIRPEDIDVRKSNGAGSAVNCLPATVEAALFVGDHYECRVRVGDEDGLLVSTPRSVPMKEGDSVWLNVNEDALMIWPR